VPISNSPAELAMSCGARSYTPLGAGVELEVERGHHSWLDRATGDRDQPMGSQERASLGAMLLVAGLKIRQFLPGQVREIEDDTTRENQGPDHDGVLQRAPAFPTIEES
jgi:hypothetical protein